MTRISSFLICIALMLCLVGYASHATAQPNEALKVEASQADATKADTIAGAAAPSATAELFYESDPKSWARVKRIVPPKYPEAMLMAGQGAVVDIEVQIGKLGFVSEIRSVTAKPANPELVEATRKVLQYWKFNVPSSARCMPIESVGEMSLIFKVLNGEGVITLEHRSEKKLHAKEQKAPKMINRDAITAIALENFPRGARRAGAEAIVYSVLTIDHHTGETLNADVAELITSKGYEKMFTDAAMPALKAIKFEPFADKTAPWKVCMVINFMIGGESNK